MFCTEPPSSPQNLVFTVTSTTISLSWDQPLSLGGRNDLLYVISYQAEGTEDKATRTVGIANLTLTGLMYNTYVPAMVLLCYVLSQVWLLAGNTTFL